MPSSPLQFVNAQTQSHLPTATSLRRCRKRRRPIGAALSQQRPGGTRYLVGKRHRDYLEWFAGEKLDEPGILLRPMACVPQHRTGSDHQNASQIAIALFRDRPELLLAASRIFARHDSDPGREVTTRSKNLRIRDGCCNRGGPDNTNSGDALEPLARLVPAMLRHDSFPDASHY